MPDVYLIHLNSKIANRSQHYLGYTSLDSVDDRLKRHKNNTGARFLAEANRLHIDYDIVRTWHCDNVKEAKILERKLKKRHNSKKLCPVCSKKEIERVTEDHG